MPRAPCAPMACPLPTSQASSDALEQWWLRERTPGRRGRRRRSRAAGRSSFPTRWRSEIEPRLSPAALVRCRTRPLPLRTPCARHPRPARQPRLCDRGSGVCGSAGSDRSRGRLCRCGARGQREDAAAARASAALEEEDPRIPIDRVVRAKEYIRAGDIYQANLARPWRVTLAQDVTRSAALRHVACGESRAVRGPGSVGWGVHRQLVARATRAHLRRPAHRHPPDRRHAAPQPQAGRRHGRDDRARRASRRSAPST